MDPRAPIYIFIFSLVCAALLFLAVSLAKLEKARRFVHRSLYILLPLLVLSYAYAMSLGEEGAFHVSQVLWASALFLLVAEGLGLLVSSFVNRARAFLIRDTSKPGSPTSSAPKGPPPPDYYENPYAAPWCQN
jgi:hypothetical protein